LQNNAAVGAHLWLRSGMPEALKMPDFKAYVRENLPPLGITGACEIEIVEELALEFEAKYERAIGSGLTPEQAWESVTNRAELWRDLGDELRLALNERRPNSRKRRNGSALSRFTDHFLKDLKHSARMFLQAPGFTIAAIAALALGIGTSTAIFSVVNTVLLKPFAYPDAERIVMFQNTFQQGDPTGSASPTEFNWWRQQTESFEYISAYDFGVANSTGESVPEQIPTMHVSTDFFRLCGATALYGRTFTAADDVPNAPKTVVLDYAFWQRHFGGDPRVIGEGMTLSANSYEIIGVVGPHLQNGQISEQSLGAGDIEIEEPPDVYIPFQLDPSSSDRGHYFNVAGRLKPGVSLAAANAQLQASFQEYTRKWPDLIPGAWFRVQSLKDAVVGGVRKSLLTLVGAVGFVLLIACANVANLLLARATGRKREIAIRAAVGAGRGRIVRQLLTESVILSLAGGVLGLAAGYAGIRGILRLSPGNIPRIGIGGSNVDLDWQVLGFTLALSILTGILFGLVPALQSSRADLSSTLKESGNRSGTGLRHNRTRALLVTIEMALALVLLIGAALLIRTFIAIRQVNPGFDAHNVLTMRMSLTGPQFEKPAGVTQVVHEGVRRISRFRVSRSRGLPVACLWRTAYVNLSKLRHAPRGRLLRAARDGPWSPQATSRPSRFPCCEVACLRNGMKPGRR
jgi:putative ABC transport system permease protein